MSVILLCKITHLFKKFQGFPIQTPFSGIILFCVCETLNSEKILIKKYCCVLFRPLISKADFEPLAKDDSMFPLGSCYAVHWFVVKWQKRNRRKGSYILGTRTTKRSPTCWRPRNRLGAQTSSFLLQGDTLVKNYNDRLQCYAASSLLRHLPLQHVRKFTADHNVRERV